MFIFAGFTPVDIAIPLGPVLVPLIPMILLPEIVMFDAPVASHIPDKLLASVVLIILPRLLLVKVAPSTPCTYKTHKRTEFVPNVLTSLPVIFNPLPLPGDTTEIQYNAMYANWILLFCIVILLNHPAFPGAAPSDTTTAELPFVPLINVQFFVFAARIKTIDTLR